MSDRSLPIRTLASYDEVAIRQGSVDDLRVGIQLRDPPTDAQFASIVSIVKGWFSDHTWFNIDPYTRDNVGWLVRLTGPTLDDALVYFDVEFGALNPLIVVSALRDRLLPLQEGQIIELWIGDN